MMKRIIPLILLALLLTGCASALNGSQEYVTPHNSAAESDTEPVYIDVSSYYELRQAMLSLVANHETTGIIRFSSYSGNMEEDLNNACIFITNDTALGSYSVSYVGSSLNRIVSYYEATISIIYKKDASETNRIIQIEDAAGLDNVMKDMLEKCSESVAIQTSSYSIDQDTFAQTLNRLYYADPQLIVAMPKMNVAEYSDTDGMGRIYELTMEYAEAPSVMLGKKNAFGTIVEQLSFRLENTDDKARLLYQLARYLSDTVEYSGTVPDEEYDRSASINTAYGALYERKASGEGFAMAMKLLCDWQDIDCIVVTGRQNNYIHAWNMIKVEDDWYHFDISHLADSLSSSLMLTDRQMEASYSWDMNSYPACDGDLNYNYLIDAGQPPSPDEPTPEAPPEVTETDVEPDEPGPVDD